MLMRQLLPGKSFKATTSIRLLSTNSSPLALSPEQRAVELPRMESEVQALLGDPLSVVRWAFKEFDGNLAMSTSMGIQASVLLHLAVQVKPDIPIIWVDTGYLPKETYLYANELKQVLDLNLIVVNNDKWSAARIEAIHGPKLWERDHELYGTLTKVQPLANAMNALSVNPLAMLSGLRAGQTKARAKMSPVSFGRDGRFKVLPMLRMTDQEVADYMFKYDLPKHPLQSKGYVTVGDYHSSRPLQPGEDARATRFGGKFEECGLHVIPKEPTSPGLESLEFVKSHKDTDMAVIMVKKRLADGTMCQKCRDVEAKLEQDDTGKWIGHIAVADVSNAQSEGLKLANHFEVVTAPFFLMRTKEEEDAGAPWRIARSYLLLKKLLNEAAEKKKALKATSVEENEPKLLDLKRHLEEVQSQIHLLQARAVEIEHEMTELASHK